MGPRDSRDPTETSGNDHSPGKKKGKAKISRNSSVDSLHDLTPEAVGQGIAALREIYRILPFAQTYHNEIGNIESIYGLNISQKEQIEKLETIVDELAFRKDGEMEKLQTENKAYRAKAHYLERDREDLERERATLDDTRQAIQLDMETQKKKEIDEVKQGFREKLKTYTKQIREELEKKIKTLEKDKDGLNSVIKELEKKNILTQNDLKRQKDSFELDKRSCQSHIVRLESELYHINAASIVSPRKSEFYIDSFHQLWERIRDVAVNGFQFLPEDTTWLDSDKVQNQLFTASTIFKYHPLASESTISTFLRRYAIQDFISKKMISMIQRPYFVAPTTAGNHESGTQPMDWILDTVSKVPAANSSQELTWRLTTIDKLDRLGLCSPSAAATIATEPKQDAISKEIWDQLHHFRSSSDLEISAKLSEIVSIAISLWAALRKDECQVDFDYNPSTGDRQGWDFVDDVVTSNAKAVNSPSEISVAQLPSKPFVLFPRITGSFGSDESSPLVLHAGSVLSHDSSAIREGLEEIERIDSATKEFKRSLRKGSSAQTSPIVGKYQGNWPTPHPGYT